MKGLQVMLLALAAAACLLPADGLDYFTGQKSRRRLQQGPGGLTCQTGPQSAQYRCMSLTSRPNNYQFCSRLCETSLGNQNTNSPSPSPDINNTPATSGGGTGGLGGGGFGQGSVSTTGSRTCAPCIDAQQQCQQGEATYGGATNNYFRPYVNRYYSGLGCQDTGPAAARSSPSESPSNSPSGSPSPGSSPAASGGR